MSADMKDMLLAHLAKSLPVIRDHWVAFMATAVLAFGAGYFISGLLDAHQIADQQTNIGLLRDQLAAAKERQAAVDALPPSQWRRLTDEQRRRLVTALSDPNNRPKVLVVYAMASSESRQYAAQFVDVFRAAGVEVFPREVPLSTAADVGVMVGVTILQKPSDAAAMLLHTLSEAGIPAHYTWWQRGQDTAEVDFDLFIGPPAWR